MGSGLIYVVIPLCVGISVFTMLMTALVLSDFMGKTQGKLNSLDKEIKELKTRVNKE